MSMNMAHFVKRFPRTRSSKRYCKEKFACQNEKSEAEYECESCGTVQCAACERKLHSVSKYVHHDRIKLAPVPKELLCQHSCPDQNYADLVCTNCKLRYCELCFAKVHSNPNKKFHQKIKFKRQTTPESAVQDKVLNGKVEVSDTNYDAIQPMSPLSIDVNDSLTYFSMPQTSSGDLKGRSHNGRKLDCDLAYNMSDNINLFAEEPSFHDALSPDPCITDLSLNGLGLINDRVALNEKEDSEPESSRPSSIEYDDEIFEKCRSFPLADQNESLQVGSVDDFIKKLGCDDFSRVKVISIFGNTGDGKSHTLNHTFFGGRDIFKTSPSPESCTSGVWAAFDPVHEAIIIDTEGLLGVSPNQNQRTRLLLKVLALSDIVIYRSRAERLHNDLFQFLADASKAYGKHFAEELKAASARFGESLTVSDLGPLVLVFHETQHTEVLGKNSLESADEILRKRFHDLELSIEAFSSLHYIGTQTLKPPTNFKGLLLAVKNKLRDSSVRSARRPSVIYNSLQVLNEKFSGEIERSLPETFPDQYFTCRSHCLSCNSKCSMNMNHLHDSVPHHSDKRCSYRFEYENKIFLCKACFNRGQEVVVVPKTSASNENAWFGLAKFAWSGYVLECPQCGVIYRSRQYWYGNELPDKNVVQTEIRHVWPGSNPVLQANHNAARRLLDGIHYMSDTIVSVSYKPTKMVTRWLTDKIAPPYWVPNSQITRCYKCRRQFDDEPDIHHCRSCGEGFCDSCSANKMRVPERGWGDMLVRVCDACYGDGASMNGSTESTGDPKQLMPRKVGEAIGSTVGTVASLVNYPLDMLRDSARPTYWVPDADISQCNVCMKEFGPKLKIHHCRCCGQGVCDGCSNNRRPVPSRGWDYDVRVCDICNVSNQEL